ncbi:MAG: hypothetical protein JST87_05490 [Bacteroidetes bacterium]|nr:hypothetical protein [Bacteroidota bacterium]
MLLKIAKQTTETIELKLPAYFKSDYSAYCITENEEVILVSQTLISTYSKDQLFLNSTIQDAIKCEPCTEQEFTDRFEQTMNNIDKVVSNYKKEAA